MEGSEFVTGLSVVDGPPLCANCHQRVGDHKWIGETGMLGFVHGMVKEWCGQCVAEAQLEFCRRCAGQIPEIEAKLAALKTGAV